jgi:hypothetical protein
MFFSQNGGGETSRIQRSTVTLPSSSSLVLNADSLSSSWPMLLPCTNSSCVRSIRLSSTSW